MNEDEVKQVGLDALLARLERQLQRQRAQVASTQSQIAAIRSLKAMPAELPLVEILEGKENVRSKK